MHISATKTVIATSSGLFLTAINLEGATYFFAGIGVAVLANGTIYLLLKKLRANGEEKSNKKEK